MGRPLDVQREIPYIASVIAYYEQDTHSAASTTVTWGIELGVSNERYIGRIRALGLEPLMINHFLYMCHQSVQLRDRCATLLGDIEGAIFSLDAIPLIEELRDRRRVEVGLQHFLYREKGLRVIRTGGMLHRQYPHIPDCVNMFWNQYGH